MEILEPAGCPGREGIPPVNTGQLGLRLLHVLRCRYARRVFLALALVGAAVVTTAIPRAASLPGQGPTVREMIGVNIHFTRPQPGEMEMLASTGVGWVRMDFTWGSTERSRGVYDFSHYDRLMAALDVHRIRPLFILGHANVLYEGGQPPRTDAGRRAFARLAAVAVKRYAGRGVLWEMYNEPNTVYRHPRGDVRDYVRLALATGNAMRKAAPQERCVGPAISRFDFPFLDACFRAGLLEHWSAVSVHPYRTVVPETVGPDYQRLRAMIAEQAPRGRHVPIIAGEWGYSDTWSRGDGRRQGVLLSREILTNIACGIPLTIWYDWRDDGTDPRNGEHHFGMVGHAYHAGRDPVYDPKPAWHAMRTVATMLGAHQFTRRLEVPSDQDYILLFSKGREVRTAVWTTSSRPHVVTIPSHPGTVHVTDAMGTALPSLEVVGNRLETTVTDTPRFLYR